MPLLLIIILFVFLIDDVDKKTQEPPSTKQIEAMETKIPRHGGVAGGWYNSICTGNEYGCNKGGF